MTLSRWLPLITALLACPGTVTMASTAEPEVCRVKFLTSSRARITMGRSLGTDSHDAFKLSLSKEAQQKLRQTAFVFIISGDSRRRVPASVQVTGPSNVQEPRSIDVKATGPLPAGTKYELEFETEEFSISLKYLAEIEEFGQPLVTPLLTITNGSRLRLSADVAISGYGIPVQFRDGNAHSIKPGAISTRTTTLVSGTARPAEVSYAATLNSSALKKKGQAVVAQSQLTVKAWPDAFKRPDTTGPIDFLQRFQSYGDVEVPVAVSSYKDTIGGKKAVELGDLQDASHQSPLMWISASFTTDRDQINLSERIVTYRVRRLTEVKSHVKAITELKYTPVDGLKVVGHEVKKGVVKVQLKHGAATQIVEMAPPSTVALHQPSVASIVDQLKKQQKFLEDLLTAQPERYAETNGATVNGLCTAKDVTIDTRVFLEELAEQRKLAANARSKVISDQPIEAVVDDVDAAELQRQRSIWDGLLETLETLELGVVRECNERIRAGKTINLRSARQILKRTKKAIADQASP